MLFVSASNQKNDDDDGLLFEQNAKPRYEIVYLREKKKKKPKNFLHKLDKNLQTGVEVIEEYLTRFHYNNKRKQNKSIRTSPQSRHKTH